MQNYLQITDVNTNWNVAWNNSDNIYYEIYTYLINLCAYGVFYFILFFNEPQLFLIIIAAAIIE